MTITICTYCSAVPPIHDDGCPYAEAHNLTTRTSKADDLVNHPRHYQLFPGQEAIDIIKASLSEEEFRGYCKGNALKYRLRAGEKGDTQQDIDKSNWYRNRLTK